MLVDSHCHLDRLELDKYQGNLKLALDAAMESEVTHFLCVCIDLENFLAVKTIANQYSNVDASVGLHPNEIVSVEPTAEDLLVLAEDPLVVALGETGLDYYRTESDQQWQQQRFRNHIRVARNLNKPLIIHTRQARADTLKIMKEEGADKVGGVMHCFTEDWDTAKQAMDLNFLISFSGIVTFPNAKELKEVAKRVPLDYMLLETDSPYLAPVPFRGKSNEPAYVRYVAEHIAGLKQINLDKVAEQTTRNYFKFFKKAS